MSIEALAMAGADYMECAINLEELERSFRQPQPHLVAEPEPEQNSSAKVNKVHFASLSFDHGMEWVKIKIREWARAVASNDKRRADDRAKEIALIWDNHVVPHIMRQK